MKKIVAAALLALSFTTGFTCSKNTPAPEAAAPAVEATPVMEATPVPEAVPADTMPTPVEGQPTQ
jgi:hypothetical protein